MIKFLLNNLLRQTGESINNLSSQTGISRTSLTKLANDESKMIQFETIEKIMDHFGVDSFDELFTREYSFENIRFDFEIEGSNISLNDDGPSCDVLFYYESDRYVNKFVSFRLPIRVTKNSNSYGKISFYDFSYSTDDVEDDNRIREINAFFQETSDHNLESLFLNVISELAKKIKNVQLNKNDVITFAANSTKRVIYSWPYYVVSDLRLAEKFLDAKYS